MFFRLMVTLTLKLLILGSLLVSQMAAAEVVTGKACYRYSDNESLTAAREIALSMAKRDALEGNSVFVESTSNVENMTLKNDLITNLTTGYLKNLKVLEETEDFGLREICRTVQAEVEPVEVKQQITARIRQFTDLNKDRTGLPRGEFLRVVNAWEDRSGNLNVVAELHTQTESAKDYKRATGTSRSEKWRVKVTLYDSEGYPAGQQRSEKNYSDVGDINRHVFKLNGYKNYRITTD